MHGQGGRNTEHALHKAEQAQTHVHVQTQEPAEQEHANMQVRTQEVEEPHGGRVIGQVSNTAHALRSTRLEQAGGQGKAQELGIAELRELIRQMQGALEQTKVMQQVQAKVQIQLRTMASAGMDGRHLEKGKQTRHERQMTTRQWTHVAKTPNEEDWKAHSLQLMQDVEKSQRKPKKKAWRDHECGVMRDPGRPR